MVAQARRPDLAAFERDRYAGIAAHVLELALLRIQVGGEKVIAVDGDPDAGDLRRTACGDRDQVSERAAADQVLGALRKGHRALPVDAARDLGEDPALGRDRRVRLGPLALLPLRGSGVVV